MKKSSPIEVSEFYPTDKQSREQQIIASLFFRLAKSIAQREAPDAKSTMPALAKLFDSYKLAMAAVAEQAKIKS